MITYVIAYEQFVEVTYKSASGRTSHRSYRYGKIPASVHKFIKNAKTVNTYGKYNTFSNRINGMNRAANS